MKTISHAKTLFYHDGPQVIEAIDDDGQNYIGVMVEHDGVEERFILKAVASTRLDNFQAGLIDLRSLLLESPGGGWFLGTMDRDFDDPFTLRSQTGPLDEFPCLPEPGFFLSELGRAERKTLGSRDRRGFCGQTLGDRPTAVTAGS